MKGARRRHHPLVLVLLAAAGSHTAEALAGLTALQRAPVHASTFRRRVGDLTCETNGKLYQNGVVIDQTAIVAAIDPIDIQILQQQLQSVRDLPRITDKVVIDGKLREDVLSDDVNREPSFRRLFTHETWARYTGRSPLQRVGRAFGLWQFSSVSRAILPVVVVVWAWALGVAYSLPLLAPRIAARASQMWIPLSLQGTAIGLLLVFRTNNAYRRLEEAREQWGKLLMLLREVASKASISLPYDATCETCRYLCAFTWSLRDKLRSGDVRDDILSILLDGDELAWVSLQRSRPLAILSRLRRLMYAELEAGVLTQHMHYIIETDLKVPRAIHRTAPRRGGAPAVARHARTTHAQRMHYACTTHHRNTCDGRSRGALSSTDV